MDAEQIADALNNLVVGAIFNTPDNIRSVSFSISSVSMMAITITLNSGNDLDISRQAFFTANEILLNGSHDITKPMDIGSSNSTEDSGRLCRSTRQQNNNIRCINYIIPILADIGAVNFSGERPNTCWFI